MDAAAGSRRCARKESADFQTGRAPNVASRAGRGRCRRCRWSRPLIWVEVYFNPPMAIPPDEARKHPRQAGHCRRGGMCKTAPPCASDTVARRAGSTASRPAPAMRRHSASSSWPQFVASIRQSSAMVRQCSKGHFSEAGVFRGLPAKVRHKLLSQTCDVQASK